MGRVRDILVTRKHIGNGNIALSVSHGHWDFRQEISDDLKRSTVRAHIKVKERKRKNMQKSRR